jgi:hypothetical protein
MGPLITRALPWSEQTSGMTTRLSIGDFSRMTYLSVKSLRRYHDMGLLEPAGETPAPRPRSSPSGRVYRTTWGFLRAGFSTPGP